MIRQQFFIIAALAIACATPTYAGDYDNQSGNQSGSQGSGWKATANEEASGSTMNGRLYRNAADQNGVAPYMLLDRYGVVKGYVAPSSSVDLEGYVGKQVSLQGSNKALPGGDMTCLTVDRVLGGEGKKTVPPLRHAAPPARLHPVALSEDQGDIAPQPTPLHYNTPNSNTANSATQTRPRPAQTARPRAYDDRDQQPTPVRPKYAQSSYNQPSYNQSSQPTYTQRSNRSTRPQAASYQEPIPTPAGMQPARATMAPIPTPESAPFVEAPDMSGSMNGPVAEDGGPYMVQGGPHYRHGTPILDDDCDCDSCACGSCGSGCGPCNVCGDDCDGLPAHRPLFCIGPTGLWVQADYLLWSQRGMYVPPLVTSGPDAANPGILGDPGTTVLFGGKEINDLTRSGGRITAGVWLNACQTFGIEGEYLALGDQNTDYYLWSDGNPIVSRPFFNVGPGPTTNGQPFNAQDAELVAETGVVAGSVAVNAKTTFDSESARFVFALCKCEGCWSDCCNAYHDSYHSYLMVGYRHLDLNDTLGIQENLTDAGFNSYSVHDEFDTQNTFNGGEIAMKFEFQRNRWWFDITPKVALGDTHQVVNINGSTQITDPTGARTTYTGGLLAQQTNIGSYSRDQFGVVPEIDLNVGYQVTPHARLEAGYSFVYWNNVVRSGEQIDTSVNAAYIPPGQTLVGDPTRPRFAFESSSYWAQGVNFGLKLTW